MVLTAKGNIVAKPIQGPAGNFLVFLQGMGHMFFDIGAVLIKQIIFIPVKQEPRFHSTEVLIPIAAPYDYVSQVSTFHTGFIHTIGIGNDNYLHIKPL